MSESWRESAACREAPKEIFFPVARAGKYAETVTDRALAYCDHCPVSDDCYNFARLDRERSGIWGGVILEPGTKRRKRRPI